MEPCSVCTGNDALCAENSAVFLAGKPGKSILKFLAGELLCSLNAEVREYLVSVVAVVMMVMVAAAALLTIMVMVLMLVLIAVMIVMVVAALVVVVMMVVVMLVLVLIVVIMVVMVMAALMVVVIIVIVVVMSAYGADALVLEQFLCKAVLISIASSICLPLISSHGVVTIVACSFSWRIIARASASFSSLSFWERLRIIVLAVSTWFL